MRHRRSRFAGVLALVIALLIAAPLSWFALADPAPDPGPPVGTSNLIDPTVSDGLTGGALPSLPVPANPVPGGLPAVPTELDPQNTEDVGDGSVDIALMANGGSGVTGTLTVQGRQVVGQATGLAPGRRYVSLYYGDGSTARTSEVLTCADVRTAAFTQSWLIDGEWQVDQDGNGTLAGTAPRDLADGVYTASTRRVPSTAGADPGRGFTPVQYPVVACGAVPSQ